MGLWHESIIKCADNTGIIKACIVSLSRFRWGTANIGRVVRTNVRAKDKSYTGDKSPRGIIVRTKEGMMRKDGSRIRFDENSFVVLANNKPKGNKIKGPLPYEVRHSVRNLSKWVF